MVDAMGKFSKIYPFATENLNYLSELNLNNKKVITITGSGDHVLNMVLQGCQEITTFDINAKTKYYTKLKIFLIKHLSYKAYLNILGLNNKKISLTNNSLFERKYLNKERIIKQNPYLREDNYYHLKSLLKNAKIKYIHSSFEKLKLNSKYDYMFLSNISDYLKLMYKGNYLSKYRDDILKHSNNVNHIYFAYVYNYGSIYHRTDIDNINKVKAYFKKIKIKKLDTALINTCAHQDAVLIKERR